MGIQIGSNNTFQGNINIGDKARQIAKDFNQEFDSVEKLMELLRADLTNHYKAEDREIVLRDYDVLQSEMAKPAEEQNTALLKTKVKGLKNAFSFLSDVSSIASLFVTIAQLL